MAHAENSSSALPAFADRPEAAGPPVTILRNPEPARRSASKALSLTPADQELSLPRIEAFQDQRSLDLSLPLAGARVARCR